MIASQFRSFAIVPAAGRSQRMGQQKLLLPWRGTTLIEYTLAAWRSAGITEIIVVVRDDDRQLAERVQATGVQMVVPDSPPPQMKDSVELGLRYVATKYQPSTSDVWLLAPADMPTIAPQVVQSLLAAHDVRHPSILVPHHQGRPGHPVLIPWPLAEHVSRLGKNEGINMLVNRGPTRSIECGELAIPADLDTPSDYSNLKNEDRKMWQKDLGQKDWQQQTND